MLLTWARLSCVLMLTGCYSPLTSLTNYSLVGFYYSSYAQSHDSRVDKHPYGFGYSVDDGNHHNASANGTPSAGYNQSRPPSHIYPHSHGQGAPPNHTTAYGYPQQSAGQPVTSYTYPPPLPQNRHMSLPNPPPGVPTGLPTANPQGNPNPSGYPYTLPPHQHQLYSSNAFASLLSNSPSVPVPPAPPLQGISHSPTTYTPPHPSGQPYPSRSHYIGGPNIGIGGTNPSQAHSSAPFEWPVSNTSHPSRPLSPAPYVHPQSRLYACFSYSISKGTSNLNFPFTTFGQ